jgi:hypothetical protein
MIAACDCEIFAEQAELYLEGQLPKLPAAQMAAHLKSCRACRETLGCLKSVHGLVQFLDDRTAPDDRTPEELAVTGTWYQRMGAAPWWFVSLTLHVLIIALASLVSMSIEPPKSDDSIVMVTELQPRAALKDVPPEPPKAAAVDVLAKAETPATDINSKEASDIVVPPDILAKAELGDHFETINPDRPDTHSAYGNEESRSFHSVEGNAEPPGGGGMGGLGMDDLIGVGGAASRGSGGGFGGGNGTGVGIGEGAGKGSFGNRNGGGRRLMVRKHGGSAATESAVDRALNWLAYHQEPDGHWDIKKYEGGNIRFGGEAYDEGVSALATLAFLGAGHTTRVGQYRDNVKRAVAWLMSRQLPSGRFSGPRLNDFDQYDLAISAMALSEAFGMTGDKQIGEAAQKTIDEIIRCQQPHGGWNHSAGGTGSTSLFGWMILALKSAKVAKLTVPATVYENAIRRLTDISEIENKDGYRYWGAVGYTSKDYWICGHKYTMTAIGMTCLQFMGLGTETERQAEMIASNPPHWTVDLPIIDANQRPQNFYHWYYGTLGMFQTGGESWKKWNEALKDTLLPNQCKGSKEDTDGSWDPVTTYDVLAGRVYSTAMGALCLEIYYRYEKLK